MTRPNTESWGTEQVLNRKDNLSQVGYIHQWLSAHYGKADMCEHPECEGKSKSYDWAKKTGCEYERNRDNFMKLCRSCHRRYDLTEPKKKQASNNLWWATNGIPPSTIVGAKCKVCGEKYYCKYLCYKHYNDEQNKKKLAKIRSERKGQ